MKTQMKTGQEPFMKHIKRAYRILEQIEDLTYKLSKIKYDQIPDCYGKSRLLDKIGWSGHDLTEIGSEVYQLTFPIQEIKKTKK